MNARFLGIYLNDHLAGATLGCDHARQLEEMSADTPFGPEMTRIATDIEQDRDSLADLMERQAKVRAKVMTALAYPTVTRVMHEGRRLGLTATDVFDAGLSLIIGAG